MSRPTQTKVKPAKKKPASKKRGPPKGQGGRPPKLVIDDKVLRQVEAMAGLGLIIEDIASVLGLGERTLDRYKANSEELQAAYKKGKARGALEVTSSLRQQINAGSVASTIFYLKTQCRWKEPPREISGPDGGPIEHKHGLSDETALAIRKKVLGIEE